MKMEEQQITLLMATYNGERFIRQQLDSLLAQNYKQWQLIIRDDGSTDKTVDIINEYIPLHKNISLVINNSPIKGACTNFAALFNIARQDAAVQYIMFCDQDDIWKPGKIALSVNAMQALEQEHLNQPILVYGDFDLMTTDADYMPGEFKLKKELKLKNLLSFNSVYGCTTILNRRLMDEINTIPTEAINHDYWVALVASIYPSKFLPDKLLGYRQHTNNASGNVAGNNSMAARLKRNLLSPGKEIENLSIRLTMFSLFYQRYRTRLSADDQQIITDYLNAFDKNRLSVCYVMLRDKIFRKGLFQTVASFVQVLFFYNKIHPKKV
jgi:rhamnosyltransferase